MNFDKPLQCDNS